MKQTNEKTKESSFTMHELIVVISIMMIMGGIVFLNYGSHRDTVDLNNAVSQVMQSIRKAQDLNMAQAVRPNCCNRQGYGDADYCASLADDQEDPYANYDSQNYTVLFEKEKSYVSLYVDKGEVEGDDDIECIVENKHFSPRIEISEIVPPIIVDEKNQGWVGFLRKNFLVRFNDEFGKEADQVSITDLEITFCVKSSCDENYKKITISNKGVLNILE